MLGKEVRMSETQKQAKLVPDEEPEEVETEARDSHETDEEIPDSVQPDLTSRTSELGELQAHEPRDDRGGHKTVVTTSSTNGRGSYHKQDPHADGVAPACSTTLSSAASEWIRKPKTSMERASTTACDDPACYGGDAE